MQLATHILTGATIGSKISNPILAVALAVASHYILDILPHPEYKIPKIKEKNWKNSYKDLLKVTLDFFLGMAFIFFIFRGNPLQIPLLGMGFIAALPDGIVFLNYLFPRSPLFKAHHNFHYFFHIDLNNNPFYRGLIIEIFIVLISIFILLF